MPPTIHSPDPPPPTSLIGAFWRRESDCHAARAAGQGLVEYALILVLIAIVVIGALSALGTRVESTYSEVNCALDGSCAAQTSGAGTTEVDGGPLCPPGTTYHTDQGQGNSARCR